MIVEFNQEITIVLGEQNTLMSSDPPCFTSGEILSTQARDVCDACGEPDCCSWDCVSHFPQKDAENEIFDRLMANGALHGVESFLLALAVAGVDVKTSAFIEAWDTVMDAIGENDLGSVGKPA